MIGNREVEILQSQIKSSSIEIARIERKDLTYFDSEEVKEMDCLVITFRITSNLGEESLITQGVPLLKTKDRVDLALNSLVKKSKWALRERLEVLGEMLKA